MTLRIGIAGQGLWVGITSDTLNTAAVLLAWRNFSRAIPATAPWLSSYRANAAPDETITNALVHEIDIASWLLGENIVDTTVHRVRPNWTQSVEGLVDPVFIVMHSASGVLITVSNNAASGSGYEIHTEVVFEQASITLDHSHHRSRIRKDGLDGRQIPESYLPVFKEAYAVQMMRWFRAVADGTN